MLWGLRVPILKNKSLMQVFVAVCGSLMQGKAANRHVFFRMVREIKMPRDRFQCVFVIFLKLCRCSRNRSPSRLLVSPMYSFLHNVQFMQQITAYLQPDKRFHRCRYCFEALCSTFATQQVLIIFFISFSSFCVDLAFITLSARVEAVFNNAKSTSFFVDDFLFTYLKPVVFFCQYLLLLLLRESLSLRATSSTRSSDGCFCLSTFASSSTMSPPSSSLSLGTAATLVTVSA